MYQEAGVNPLSGCLPLLIQMPILFGLYAALVAVGPMLTNAGFFWIPDLSYPQYSMGLNWITTLWDQGNYITLISYLILPVLLVVTQFVMQKWMTPTPATAGDDSSAKMTQNMSLVMTPFLAFHPAGTGRFDRLPGDKQPAPDAPAVERNQVLRQEIAHTGHRRYRSRWRDSKRGTRRGRRQGDQSNDQRGDQGAPPRAQAPMAVAQRLARLQARPEQQVVPAPRQANPLIDPKPRGNSP